MYHDRCLLVQPIDFGVYSLSKRRFLWILDPAAYKDMCRLHNGGGNHGGEIF